MLGDLSLKNLESNSEDELRDKLKLVKTRFKRAECNFEFSTADDLRELMEEINTLLSKPSASNKIIAKVSKSDSCVCGKSILASGLCSSHHRRYLRTGFIPELKNGIIVLVEKPLNNSNRDYFSLAKYVT